MIDLRTQTDDGVAALGECDVCIIGTGPAGATLAEELSGSRLRVTVLESGSPERTERADRLDDVESVGRVRQPDQWEVRNRILGGSSHTWGGRCAPFDEIDHQARSWVPGSGWPFPADELTPYLDRSAHHLGLAVGTGFSDDSFWSLSGRQPPPGEQVDPSRLRPFFWQFSREVDASYPFEYRRFGRSLARRLGANVTLVVSATVVRIEPATSGRVVESVVYVGPDGTERSLRAGLVVLATGGIENARLLLASDTVAPTGLGNDRDLVGRYLMDHPRGSVGAFDVAASAELAGWLGRYNARGRLFRAGFRLSPEVQRAEGLLNAATWLGETVAEDDPWNALRRVVRRSPDLPDDLFRLVRGTPLLARGARDYLVEHHGIPRALSGLDLLAMVEQRPDPESRITLSERRDAHGSRLPRIDWRSHPDEGRTVRRVAELVVEQLAALGHPVPVLAEWVRDGADLPDTYLDVAHPTGTTRMSRDPASGVVDADGQVHGVDGLYVTGSSVFPTSGHCNPTQMVVALAIRLADHLLTRQEPAPVTVRSGSRTGPVTVLVTGATGRIGRYVVDDLLERGYAVRAVTSREELPAARPGLEWRHLDLLDPRADHDDLVEGCQVVMHLAAEIGRQERMQRINVDATRQLAEAAERRDVTAFVYTSSVSVYGSGRRRTMREDGPVLTTERDVSSEYLAMDYVRTYGRTKLAGERALGAVADRVRYTVLRPSVVVDEDALLAIGEWDRTKRVLAAHRHAHHVYVRDVADVMIWAAERALDARVEAGAVEVYNVAEDDRPGATHAAFLRKALEASGDARYRVPRFPGLVDWLHDLVRFRRLTTRNPLWRLRFPDDRLVAAGYRRRWGMERAERRALDRLRGAATSGSTSVG